MVHEIRGETGVVGLAAAAIVCVASIAGCMAPRTSHPFVSAAEYSRQVRRVSRGLARSSWPMDAHDPMRTRRSDRVGPDKPSARWLPLEGLIIDWVPAIGADGTMYCVLDTDKLGAVTLSDHLKWTVDVDYEAQPPAVAADGTIYVGSSTDMRAFGSDGSTKWCVKVPGRASAPVVGPDGTVYFADLCGEPRGLRAFSPKGKPKWSSDIDNKTVAWEPAIAPDSTVYVSVSADDETFDTQRGFGELHALRSSGSQKWKLDAGIDLSRPAIGGDGTIYLATLSGELWAVSPEGSRRWTFDAGRPRMLDNGSYQGSLSDPAITADGTVYVAGFKLFAVRPDGTKKWEFSADTKEMDVQDSGLAVDAEGTVYFVNRLDGVYAVRADGTRKWKVPLKGSDFPGVCMVPWVAIGPSGEILVGIRWKGLLVIEER